MHKQPAMNIAIVGGGLAGLAAGCELADRGHQVTLFERRPWAGGKTYSFVDRETGEAVDNGQHVFMACTTAYTGFLRKLGTLHLTRRQRRLRVPVFDQQGRRSDLWAGPLPAPLHFGPSFARYRHLSMPEKLRIARALAGMTHASVARADLQRQTFGDWLRRHGQTERTLREFWDLIAVPTLNCTADDAGAAQAIFVFREGFLKSSTSAALGVPAAGLSALHVDPALRYLERAGAEIRLSAEVERLDVRDGRVAALELKGGGRRSFDVYLAALPPHQLLRILPPELHGRSPFDRLARYRYAPIVNLHFWFSEPVAPFAFAAFTGSDLQWIFNRTRIGSDRSAIEEHLVLSLSAAGRFMELDKAELRDHFLAQVQRALPRARTARLTRFLAVKEPDATFVPAPGLERVGLATPFTNLVMAGAHIATGWPATMESAVRSGLAAADALDGVHFS